MTSARTFPPLAAGAAALLIVWPAVAAAFNPQPEPPGTAIGDYEGYSQSETHPDYHPYMALSVEKQDDKGSLFGVLTMGAPGGDVRFPFQGKLTDDQGHFRGKGFDSRIGEVKFEGVLQSVGFGNPPDDGTPPPDDQTPPPDDEIPPPDDTTPSGDGVLAIAHYKFTDIAGNVDQGMTWLLRSFATCADCSTPDLTGDWRGAAMSQLTGRNANLTLRLTGQGGTRFTGIAEVAGVDPEPFSPDPGAIGTLGVEPQPFSWAVVGTIDPRGNIFLIGVGDSGFVEVGAMHHPRDPIKGGPASINGLYFDRFATGANNLGVFEAIKDE